MTRLIDKLRNNNKDILEMNWPGTLDKLEELITEANSLGRGSILVEISSKQIEELLNKFSEEQGLTTEMEFNSHICNVGIYIIFGYKDSYSQEIDCAIDNNGVMRIKK